MGEIIKLIPNLTIAGIRAGLLYLSYCCFVVAAIIKVIRDSGREE
jgi:hypothetical protein